MNFLYASYLFISALILFVLAAVAWRRSSVSASREFALFSASVAFLMASDGRQTAAARLLDIDYSRFKRLLEKHGIVTSISRANCNH